MIKRSLFFSTPCHLSLNNSQLIIENLETGEEKTVPILPTSTKKERKHATQFRKNLEKDGFSMMQYSVYIRHCPSKENGDVHIKRIKSFIPDVGYVSILSVTDKQHYLRPHYN